MWIKILLIIFGIPILILPITSKIKDKKLTIYGLSFLICVLAFTTFQIINESQNSKQEVRLVNEKKEIMNKVDSLRILSKNLTDSIDKLKHILLSIDNQFYRTNKKIFQLGKVNDSLNQLVFLTDRPVFHNTSSMIVKSTTSEYQYMIDIDFINEGKRSATNVYGKRYTIIGYDNPEIYDNGTIQISRTDVFPDQHGFTVHVPMKFNPDSTNFDKPVYYYFDMKYSDIILKTQYQYEIAVRMDPIKKSKYINELSMCRDWEQAHLKKLIYQK